MNYSWKTVAGLQQALRGLLTERHAGQVALFSASFEGDTLVLRGEVASEDCRADAKQLALAFDDVFKVRNLVEVAAFLESASDSQDDDAFLGLGRQQQSDVRPDRSKPRQGTRGGAGTRTTRIGQGSARRGPAARRGQDRDADLEDQIPQVSDPAEVVRSPVVQTIGEVAPGSTFDLMVNLTIEEQPDQEQISLGAFPPDWSSIKITVQIAADWLEVVEAEVPNIVLEPQGSGQPAKFRCTVSRDVIAGSAATVMIYFLHGTRICGHVAHEVVATGIAEAAPASTRDDEISGTDAGQQAADALASNLPSVTVIPEAAGPTLTVMISRIDDGRQLWAWRALGSDGTASGSACAQFNNTVKAFADSLLESCPDLKVHEFRRRMRGTGELIWRAAPELFRQSYQACRSRFGAGFPIQFLTDDPFVPWEMMVPDFDDDIDHLYIEHPVGRWPLNGAGPLRPEFGQGAIISFVPTYSKALNAAADESDWICSDLGATKMPPLRNAFLDVLDGKHPERVKLIHFAGHGRADTGVNDGGIQLQDAQVGILDVYQGSVRVGKMDAPLLVLNACETSAGAEFLGMNTGWGAAVAAREFGGLIAPLWAVQDKVAFKMIKESLPPLVSGSATLGAAVTSARAKHADAAVAVFAYLAHGDVMARFARF